MDSTFCEEELNRIISDEEIDKVFENTNFGTKSKRSVVKGALLKAVSGYHNGYTSDGIIKHLGLITKTRRLTKKGKRYLFFSYVENPPKPF